MLPMHDFLHLRPYAVHVHIYDITVLWSYNQFITQISRNR